MRSAALFMDYAHEMEMFARFGFGVGFRNLSDNSGIIGASVIAAPL